MLVEARPMERTYNERENICVPFVRLCKRPISQVIDMVPKTQQR